MLRARIIPCLLLKNGHLVKTVKFSNPKYVGDPINAVRIFDEKEVDELIFLDISATIENKKPDFELIGKIASECFMPFAYGGGIKDVEDAKKILKIGAEKIVINSHAVENPKFIKELSEIFGSQSIVVSLDIKKNGDYLIYINSGTKNTKINPLEFCNIVEKMGAGELFINSIDRDGTMKGYDLELVKSITQKVSVPVIACGGAGSLKDLIDVIKIGGASAAAAGSMFVFHGKHKAVLINYPTKEIQSDLL